MIYLSQRNPLWAGDRLGASSLTLGRYGCTTTSISMLSDYFKCYQSPPKIAQKAENYTKDGLILWNKLSFDKMQFVERIYFYDRRRIEQAMKDPKQAVILEVNNRSHWVVALRKTYFGDDIVILDPWTGAKAQAFKDYHEITGAAFFKQK